MRLLILAPPFPFPYSANACHANGVTFASVHDSFWTHAAYVKINRVSRGKAEQGSSKGGEEEEGRVEYLEREKEGEKRERRKEIRQRDG